MIRHFFILLLAVGIGVGCNALMGDFEKISDTDFQSGSDPILKDDSKNNTNSTDAELPLTTDESDSHVDTNAIANGTNTTVDTGTATDDASEDGTGTVTAPIGDGTDSDDVHLVDTHPSGDTASDTVPADDTEPMDTHGTDLSTKDGMPPYVLSVQPPPGATYVISEQIIITFSEPMDTGSVNGALHFPYGQPAFSWKSDTVLTINSAFQFSDTASIYQYAIDVSAKDKSGEPLAAQYDAAFSLAALKSQSFLASGCGHNGSDVGTWLMAGDRTGGIFYGKAQFDLSDLPSGESFIGVRSARLRIRIHSITGDPYGIEDSDNRITPIILEVFDWQDDDDLLNDTFRIETIGDLIRAGQTPAPLDPIYLDVTDAIVRHIENSSRNDLFKLRFRPGKINSAQNDWFRFIRGTAQKNDSSEDPQEAFAIDVSYFTY